MNTHSSFGIRHSALVILLSLLVAGFAQAQPTVTAKLADATMTAGDQNQLTLIIEGASRVSMPREITAEGLSIRLVGQRENTRIENLKFSSNVQLTYSIEAENPGVFTIPAIQIQTDGKTLSTAPLQVTVKEMAAGLKSGSPNGQIAFSEILIPKTSAYLGESIPVELRVYVESQVRWQAEQMPSFEGEGFTKQKMPDPRQNRVTRDGKEYDLIVFKTAITPSKAGKILVGPSEMKILAQVPTSRKRRARSPLDEFFSGQFDDFETQPKRLTLKAPAHELEIKPLPAAGKPANFSGAVGSFQFSATGSPNKVKIGDPITMKLKVSGQGNFDRINAPTLENPEGWHTYPATSEFNAHDDVSLSGTKSFEIAIIPEKKKSTLPQFVFSYFDPATEKYVTLRNEPLPLEVEGVELPAKPQVVASASPAATPPPATPTDIVGLRYDFGTRRTSFAPVSSHPSFLWAQSLPAGLLLALFAISRLRSDNPQRSRRSRLQTEKLQLKSKLQRQTSRNEFFELATQLLRVESALATGLAPEQIDAERARSLADPALAEVIDEIFQARAEILYAGQAAPDSTIPDSERQPLLAALHQFEKHAQS